MALFSVVIENRPDKMHEQVIPRVFDCEERAFNYVLEYAIDQLTVHHSDIVDQSGLLPKEVADILSSSEGVLSIKSRIKDLGTEIQQVVIDEVFEYLNDELTVAYYRIDEQVLDNDSGLITLSDCLIRDWRYSEDLKSDIPEDCRDYYRLTVEQAQSTGQIYIKLYPNIIDELSEQLPEHGLGLCIEVRDGLPALSMGLTPYDLDVRVESDLNSNLVINNDITGTELEVQLDNGDWLRQARTAVAELAYEKQMFEIEGFIDDSGAEFDGKEYKRTFFQRREDLGESVAYEFHCTFLGDTLAYDWGYKVKS